MSIDWVEHFKFEIFSQTTPQNFSGFVTVAELREKGCRQAPEQPGVYMVNCPRFCNPGSGGHFRGKDPNVTLEKLKEKWVEKAHILARPGAPTARPHCVPALPNICALVRESRFALRWALSLAGKAREGLSCCLAGNAWRRIQGL